MDGPLGQYFLDLVLFQPFRGRTDFKLSEIEASSESERRHNEYADHDSAQISSFDSENFLTDHSYSFEDVFDESLFAENHTMIGFQGQNLVYFFVIDLLCITPLKIAHNYAYLGQGVLADNGLVGSSII